jgi:hypothetical protein
MHPIVLAESALELAMERTAEAEQRARWLRGSGPLPPSLPRRLLGRVAAWISRVAAAAAVRLDDRLVLPGRTSAEPLS